MYWIRTWHSCVLGVVTATLLIMPLSTVYQVYHVTDDETVPLPNHPPDAPTLEGPRTGAVGTPYYYTACASDPDGDDLYYTFDWGDGCMCTVACRFASGEPCTACHCWDTCSIYPVRACAADEHRCYGAWCDPVPVVMPKRMLVWSSAIGVNSK